MSTAIDWRIDETALEAFRRGLGADESPIWFGLRREAEQMALRPNFERFITLDHNTIKELPHQIKVANPTEARRQGLDVWVDRVVARIRLWQEEESWQTKP